MLHLLNLLLPALFPSWRFFKSVEPSPRVQWTLEEHSSAENWREFRPRPRRVSIWQIALRLFWNPVWNETLYLVSCADRIHHEPTEHSIREIRHRIQSERKHLGTAAKGPEALRFRLVFVRREGSELVEEVVYQSDRVADGPS